MNNGEEIKSLVLKTVLFFIIAAAAYGVLFFAAGSTIREMGRHFAGKRGLTGIFLYVYLVDTFIVPATPDIVFTLSTASPLLLITVVSTASISGGFTGYLIGRYLNHLSIVRKVTAYYRAKGEALIHRYGPWAVALAGFTPLPYSTISWLAGMFKIKPGQYLLASLTRIPRLTLYYMAIQGGMKLFS